ncbi:MAG: hypothetical protein AAB836_01950 [Patescibacteria group bacterium]
MTYLRPRNNPINDYRIQNLKNLNFRETKTFKETEKEDFDTYVAELRANNKKPAVDFAYVETEVEVKATRGTTKQKVYKVFEK